MSNSRCSQVPIVAYDYFRASPLTGVWESAHPVITEEFRPGRGWTRYPGRKRVSVSWLRKMRAEGVTHVALTAEGCTADFSITELVQWRITDEREAR